MGVGSRAIAYPVKDFSAMCGEVPFSGNVLAIDLSNVSRASGRSIDGLIGADFFRSRRVEIDFTRKLIILDGDPAEKALAHKIPIRETNGAFCIPVVVDGARERWMRLDTGCNDAARVVSDKALHFSSPSKSIAFTTRSQLLRKADLELGGARLKGIPIAVHDHEIFPGEAGLLGTGVLSRFNVTIDVPHHGVTLVAR